MGLRLLPAHACAHIPFFLSLLCTPIQATQELATAENALAAAEKRVEDAEE